jgi:hypothetical protein
MGPSPAERSSCDDSNHPVKPRIVEQYSQHVGYVNNADRIGIVRSLSDEAWMRSLGETGEWSG